MSFTRYEIRVRPLQGAVMVEAVLFDEPVPGLPPLGTQFIAKGFGGSGPWVAYVYPPNWWERWRGVSWDQKVERARAKVEHWAQREVATAAAARAAWAAAEKGERGGGGRMAPDG
jgi:hypothetical protein